MGPSASSHFFCDGAAIVVSLTGGLTGILWQWRKAETAREEASQRAQAETQAREQADRALTLLEIQRAEDFFARSDSARALAYLARVLRQNPANEVAAARVLSALSQRSFEIRGPEPFRQKAAVIAQFSPDGKWLVTASGDHTARVWDVATGQPLIESPKHRGWVRCAKFSRDGKQVVSASEDKTARVWDADTGQPLTEPLQHHGQVYSARFSPDGHRVVTASEDRTARIWEIPTGAAPVPDWLPKLTEAIAGKRFNDQGVSVTVPATELLALKRQLAESSVATVWTRWAQWFFADSATRTISPFSEVTVPDYVQNRIRENTLESLQEAVRLAPENGLAPARLARRVLEQPPNDNPRRVSEADFFSRRALELAPNDPEVLQIRSEIEKQLGNLPTRLPANLPHELKLDGFEEKRQRNPDKGIALSPFFCPGVSL